MRIASILTLVFIATMVSGQDERPLLPGHQGPRFGLGLATQSAGGLFQNTSNLMPGPLLGWHFEAPLHPQLSLMPEILWMVKGAVVRNPAQDTRSRTVLHYLEVPVSVKISTEKEPNGIYLLVGPSFGYSLAGNYKSWQGDDLVIDQKYDFSESKRFQFSGMIGIGSEGERWAFDVRAQTSFTPFEPVIQTQNVVYALTIAYRIEGQGAKAKDAEDEP
jgi:hypothetical protein